MFVLNYKNCKKFGKPIFEEYYGTNKNLELGVKMLKVICDDINSKTEWEANATTYSEWKENKILCECLSKEFGFKETHLYWRHESIPNAYTIPGGFLINTRPGFKPKIFNKNKKDKYYDEDHVYICSVFVIINIVQNCNLTARETMAVILHEIGHNFDNTWTTYMADSMSLITTAFMSEFSRLFYLGVHTLFGELEKYMPSAMWLYETLKALPYHLSVVNIPNIPYFLGLIARYPTTFMFNIVTGSRAEYFSDSFAAKYGFGVETVSVQRKLNDSTKIGGYTERNLMRIPIVRTVLNLMSIPMWLLIVIIDPHPTAENRILAIRKELENDLNDPDIPPQYKQQMRRQIKLIDDQIELDKKESAEKKLFFSQIIKFITYNSPLKDYYHR